MYVKSDVSCSVQPPSARKRLTLPPGMDLEPLSDSWGAPGLRRVGSRLPSSCTRPPSGPRAACQSHSTGPEGPQAEGKGGRFKASGRTPLDLRDHRRKDRGGSACHPAWAGG